MAESIHVYGYIDLLFFMCVQLSCVVFLCIGVSSIVAQFESVNPYRWPGWFVVALALSYAAVSLVVFRDTRDPPKLKRPKGCVVSCNCLTSIKLMTQLQSNWKMQFSVSFVTIYMLCTHTYAH